MNLHGKNFIGDALGGEGPGFQADNPATREPLPPDFHEATTVEINRAADLAEQAFEKSRRLSAEQIASFLDQVADQIVALGDGLIQRARAETALPEARLTGERARTVNQIKMFAQCVREGSWVDARIDRAMPDRKPLPKPDLRRKLIPIGPVAVFAASNFPLAFSVAGGDTASALAAGNPVIVKAHPAHPGTSELVAQAIQAAATSAGIPAGIFSMVHGRSHETGLQLVRHPAIKAVGFTGSLKAGRALFDAAAARPEPIPVYAEMGSTNPVFVLPEAMQKNWQSIAQGLMQSVSLGVGQFCTNPGLVFGLENDTLRRFIESAAELARSTAPGTMLYSGICERFQAGLQQARAIPGVELAGQSTAEVASTQAATSVLVTNSIAFLKNEALVEELFGPATLIVSCSSTTDLERIARALPGQLTATLHGTEQDLEKHRELVTILQGKAGRLIFNGFPTGVEVCPSMHHGGPYPATTDVHFTSVGTAAIQRFARPVCLQNFPDPALPVELQNSNPRQLWRMVDGELTRDAL